MKTTVAQTYQVPITADAGTRAPRPRKPFAAARWLAMALVAVFTFAAQAQRTATATAVVMSGFVVDITVTDGGAGYFYFDPPAVAITGGGGSGASAVATQSNGAVSHISVLTTGSGYTGTPNVVIAPPLPTMGVTTMALQMSPMLVVDGEPGSTARVSYAESATPNQWVVITNAVLGTNTFTWCDPQARPGQRRYEAVSVPPNPSPNPRTALGTAVVYNGFVVGVTIINGGRGYLSSPSITFVGSGSGATATATISNGVVTQVTMINPGAGYGSASVVFSAPPRLTRLTEYRVPQLAVRQEPPSDVILQASTTPAGTNRWTDLTALRTSSNGAVWFDMTATQAMAQFYRTVVRPIPASMVLIPAGSFTMGNCMDSNNSLELPLHTVQVSAFYMDKYEVTKALWDGVYQWATNHGYSFDNAGSGKASTHPVQAINWYDAVKWCNARSEKEGRPPAYYTEASQTVVYRNGRSSVENGWVKWAGGYRLPTEAEWEKASRGGISGHRFPWSGTDNISHSVANYNATTNYPYNVGYPYDLSYPAGYHPAFNDGISPYTSPVGYFAANGYGLCDMAGNVHEWCWDWKAWYSSGSQTDPRGPTSGSMRVLRGGSWYQVPWYCQSSARNENGPTAHSFILGFRVVLAPVQP